MQNETNDWVTIAEAIERWRAAPRYETLHRMVKRSGIETRRCGKYLTFRLADQPLNLLNSEWCPSWGKKRRRHG